MTAAPTPPTVLVADDHPLWRDALVRDLEESGFVVVGTASDGPSTVRRTRATVPEVLVLDLNLPHMRGDEVCRAIGDLPTRVLVLSASGEEKDVLAAVKAGASGYLVKSASPEEIRDAVTATGAGEAVFTPGLAGLVLGEFREMSSRARAAPPDAEDASGRSVPELTDREVEILRYVAIGMTAREIAADLVLSHRTVQNHVQNILGKLHLHNRVELTRFAISRGLDQPDRVPGGGDREP
ncbi:response regulator transcription factor [Janibacter cremeus]|uniref:response regulator n=1 Tax=Janibacter cremeus TaxID=1285192 RepID=UPI0023F7D461|nr:response regulator transcription factor [Janibacter cremeus]WEV78945.1 response regulator transcription factor [Janibacter cremeus]